MLLDGWDASGEPVARPWTSLGFKAKAQILAVSEDQTANTWDPVLEMARNGPVGDAYGLTAMNTFVAADRVRIEYTTSSGLSREGFRPIFSVLDQSESMLPSNGGVRLAAAVRRNLSKTTGASVETPNAYVPGEKSVAESSFEAWQYQVEGRLRSGDDGILLDHREAPPDVDIEERASMLKALAHAYGASADVNGGWVSLERVLRDFWDPSVEPQDARRYYLNQITHASDSWLSQPEWAACADPRRVVADGEAVTLGFDGSKRRARGVTDATALIGCRVSDGHLYEIAVWEQPDGPAGDGWEVPRFEVEAAVDMAMSRWNVVGFFADPAMWEQTVTGWEARYGPRMKVRATASHPIEWWMTGGKSVTAARAIQRLESAVKARQVTHDGAYALTRHVLAARTRPGRGGVQLHKDSPESRRKIDAAIAAIAAYEARAQAVAGRVGEQRQPMGGWTL